MKKLITAAVASAFAFLAMGAANAVDLPSGTSFEGLSTGEKNFSDLVDYDDSGTDQGSLFWFTTVTTGTDAYTNNPIATVKQYLDGETPTSAIDIPVTNRPAQWAGDLNGKYLAVDTSNDLLYRTIGPKAASLSGLEKVEIGDGIYLDTLVQFTAADKAFEAGDIAVGDKIAISYVEREEERDGDDNITVTALTNFVVRAAYVDAANSTIVATNYFLTFPGQSANEVQFDKSAWHRLTVRAISNVGNEYAPVGFVVYVDGTNLVYTAESVGCKAAGDSAYVGSLNSVVSTYLYNNEKQALLPSLLSSGDDDFDTLAAVGFKGNGSVDDISFTATKPGILPVEGMTVTIAWDANVASYTVTAGETTIVDGEAVSGEGSTNLLLAAEVTAITVTATYAENYEPGKWTVTGEGASISGSTFTVAPGAQLNIVSIYPYFQVGDAFYQEFDGEDGALAAAIAGSGVIKLNKDYPHDIALTDGTVTIDLAGKTITGDGLAAILNGGANLIITNSTVEIGHIVKPTDPDTFAILIGGGTTSIYGGWVDGMIEFDTSDLPQDLLFLYGGYYNDANTTDPAAFYRNDCARDVVSYVGDPAHYFQVGSDTPEPPAPTSVEVPTAVENLVYDGTEKIGVIAGTGYTLTGNIATNAGNYTATATLEDGYVWADTTTEAKSINWSIAVNSGATVDLALASEIAEWTDVLDFPAVTAKVGTEDVTGEPVWDPAKISEPDAGTTNTYTVTFTVMNGGYTGSTGTATFKVWKAASGGSDWPSTWNGGNQPASMATAFSTWIAAGNDPTAANAEAAFLVGVDVDDYTSDLAAASISIVGGKIVITGNYDLTKINGALSVKMGDAPNALNTTTSVVADEGAITLAPALGETKKFYQLVIGYPAE